MPCETCPEFNRETGYCRKVDEYLLNGYAKHYWSQKCGEHNQQNFAISKLSGTSGNYCEGEGLK
jgi:hypothetical protein